MAWKVSKSVRMKTSTYSFKTAEDFFQNNPKRTSRIQSSNYLHISVKKKSCKISTNCSKIIQKTDKNLFRNVAECYKKSISYPPLKFIGNIYKRKSFALYFIKNILLVNSLEFEWIIHQALYEIPLKVQRNSLKRQKFQWKLC